MSDAEVWLWPVPQYGVPRIPKAVPVLVEDPLREEDAAVLPAAEASRRQRIAKQGYYVKLLMNGSYFAGKSSVHSMREDFTLDFNDVFRSAPSPRMRCPDDRGRACAPPTPPPLSRHALPGAPG